MTKIDVKIANKFGVAALSLMTRVFSTPLPTNERRLAVALGVASAGNFLVKADPNFNFDVLGLGFRPGREWSGPAEVFLNESGAAGQRLWRDCKLWSPDFEGPMYLLTDDIETSFSYDGWALVPLSGAIIDRDAGIRRAPHRLCEAAKRVPSNLEQHRMQ